MLLCIGGKTLQCIELPALQRCTCSSKCMLQYVLQHSLTAMHQGLSIKDANGCAGLSAILSSKYIL